MFVSPRHKTPVGFTESRFVRIEMCQIHSCFKVLTHKSLIWNVVFFTHEVISSFFFYQQSFIFYLLTFLTERRIRYLKPLSHWDETSSRWVCESIRQTIANCRETFAWYRKVLACIANSSRTGRQSFKNVILFCATKFIAKPSPSHRICREPVANPSPTLRRGRKHIARKFLRSEQCDKYAT